MFFEYVKVYLKNIGVAFFATLFLLFLLNSGATNFPSAGKGAEFYSVTSLSDLDVDLDLEGDDFDVFTLTLSAQAIKDKILLYSSGVLFITQFVVRDIDLLHNDLPPPV